MNSDSKKLIVGRIIGNFADSLFMIIFPIALYKVYNSYSVLYFYTTISLILSSLSFLLSPIINKYNKKTMLMLCQAVQFVLIIVMIISLSYNNVLSLVVIYLSCGFFTLSNLLSYIIQSALIPEVTEEEKLFKVNKVMQTSLFAVNMIADSVSALILVVLTVNEIASISVVLYLVTIMIYKRIKFKLPARTKDMEATQAQVQEDQQQHQAKEEEKTSYKESLKTSLKLVLSNKVTKGVIIMLFASGIGYQYLFTYIPAYFVDLGNDYLYPIFNLVSFLGLIVGTMLSEVIYKKKGNVVIGVLVAPVILIFLSTQNFIFLFAFVFILSIYSGALEPLITTSVQQSLKEEVSIGITAIMAITNISKLIGIQISAFALSVGGFNVLYMGYFAFFLLDLFFTSRYIGKIKDLAITFG